MHVSWKTILLRSMNKPMRLLSAEVVPSWQRRWWQFATSFELGGREFSYFYHRYNCGWPPYASERCVELALADAWLEACSPVQSVVEIGAVTPYYWPRRLSEVIDPFDLHPLVSRRESLFEFDFSARTVLSISTLEHVGLGEYGAEAASLTAEDAVRKICDESPCFLVTVPSGYNPALDRLVFERPQELPSDVRAIFMVRGESGHWSQETDRRLANRDYDAPGVNEGRSAAGLIILDRGNLLNLVVADEAASNQ